jgi:drug/metabolite transporter (DMT)-like permease
MSILPLGYSVAASGVWAITTLLNKAAVDALPARRVMLIGGAAYLACAVLFEWLGGRRGHSEHSDEMKANAIAVGAGVATFVGGLLYLWALEGVRRDDSYIVAAVAYTAPLFVLLISAVVFGAKAFRWDQVAAAATIVGATCYLAYSAT